MGYFWKRIAHFEKSQKKNQFLNLLACYWKQRVNYWLKYPPIFLQKSGDTLHSGSTKCSGSLVYLWDVSYRIRKCFVKSPLFSIPNYFLKLKTRKVPVTKFDLNLTYKRNFRFFFSQMKHFFETSIIFMLFKLIPLIWDTLYS